MRGGWSALAALGGPVVALLLGGCRFEPLIGSGTLACDRGSCPPGLRCSDSGFCCRDGDPHPRCAPGDPPGDGGAGRPAVADASAGADLVAGDAPLESGRWPRLVAGPVRLVGGASSCTPARTAAGSDRWCAFHRQKELWVINASRAAQLGSVRCDGSDPDCLRLSENVFRADLSLHPSANLAFSIFTGELLIYYADARQSADEIFRGGVYAWRPGWTVGRRLTSMNGEYCVASELDGLTVMCTDNRGNSGVDVDLIGGRLPPDGSALPRIERVTREPWLSLITSSGDYILYSYLSGASTMSDLYLVAAGQVADPGSRVLLVRDAELSAIGANGTRAYFYRSVDPMTRAGTLFRVDLPTGRNIIEIARGVQYAWHPLTKRGRELGLITVENMDQRGFGDLRLFWDPVMPSRSLTPGRTHMYGYQFSPDGRFTYTMAPQDRPLAQARVFDSTNGNSCVLGQTRTVPPVLERFSPDGSLVFWEKYTSEDGVMEAWVSSSADCAPVRQLGTRVSLMQLLDDGGAVFVEAGGGAAGGQLRYLPGGQMVTSAAPQEIATAADAGFALITGDPTSLVVFTSSVPGREGLYIAKVPF
jgi:hypothetical protein